MLTFFFAVFSLTHSLHEVAQVLCDHNYWKKPLTASEQLQAAQMELDDLEEKGRELKSEQFFLQRLQSEPELIRFYTGFKDYSTLKALYLALQPTADTIWNWCRTLKLDNSEGNAVDRGFHAHHLCLFDQLFMFLCFVRRGFLPINMSKQFKVSEATVQTTCITWCHYLFFMLGTVPVWPSRRAVDELMPTFFRTTFPKTRVVLHMTEFHVQMVPSTANSSLHKASTALKSVVGITPSGSVSFVGSVCSASISDKDIIGDSGVLNLLESGDQVMAAKSLDIKELLDLIDVNLVVPAFSGPDRRLNKDDVTHTQHMSHLKIHIERAIGRITKYQIFDDVVPAALCGSVNQLWTVCALLTNFQGPLQ